MKTENDNILDLRDLYTKSKYLKRIELLKNQLQSTKINFKSKFGLLDDFKKIKTFDSQLFEKIYFPFEDHKQMRDKMFQLFLSHPEFKVNPYTTEMSSSEMKDLLARQQKILMKEVGNFIMPFEQLRKDPIKFGIFMESINHFEIGLSVRFAFHSVLYYNSLLFLGTEIHSEYIQRNLNLDDWGCFGLTELGHGTNVRSIQTTAHYNCETQEFILNSPNYESYKWWIGGAGRTANMSIIFAQLYTKGQCHGVHAFLTPIRDRSDHSPYPGVILGDTGPKVGNESIDNGFIGFNQYRIPREALLNKFSQVSQEGNFTSTIENPDIRFATALGALSEGRVGVSLGSQILLVNALTIAGRYSFLRKQFSADISGSGQELPIITYPSTQIRVIPTLAEVLALRAASFALGMRWIEVLPFVTQTKNPLVTETHALISGLKAYSSNLVQGRLQQLREVMGGHGYSRFNLIGALRNNNDINTTWEGDNTVLVQQTAKFILDCFKNKMKGKPLKKEFTTVKFLESFDEVNNTDKNSINLSSGKDLDDINLLQKIFEFRINFHLQKTVMKLADRVEDKKDGVMTAWNNSQVFYIQNMAKAYIEYFVFNAFKERIESIEKLDLKSLNKSSEQIQSTKKVLFKFLKLYSLTIFDLDNGTLRNEDFLASDSLYIIKEEILELCSELKNEMISILEIIAPPDEILQAPMGRSDGRMYESYLNKVFAFNKAFERPDWWENLNHKKIKEKY
jgi:acyl-CoA oxidase